MIAEWLRGAAFGLLLLPALYAAGSFLAPFFSEEKEPVRGILFVGAGFGFFAFTLAIAGHFGAYRLATVAVFAVGVILIRIRLVREFEGWLKFLVKIFSPGPGGEGALLGAIFFLLLGVTALMCAAPEIANDALCYQLNLPKTFLRRMSTLPIPDDFNSYLPMFMNYLYGVGLMAGSITAAKLFHWLTGVLLTAAVVCTIEELSGKKILAVFIGLMLWLTPTVFKEIATTYVDVGAAFFLFLALHLFLRARRRSGTSLWVLSGLFLGFAAGAKYLTLMAALPFGVMLLRDS